MKGRARIVGRHGEEGASLRAWRAAAAMRRLCLLLMVCCWPALASTAQLDQALLQALDGQADVRVFLWLEDPGLRQADAPAIAVAVDALLDELPVAGIRLERRFQTVPALALTVNREGLAALQASRRIARIELDQGGGGELLQSLPLAGIDTLQAAGLNGAGRKIAIIDSGIRLDHLSFQGRIVDQACFCSNCCPNGGSTQFGPGSATASHPHGTNVAGIAAGGLFVPNVPAGAAPASRIVAIRVIDSNNSFCCSSDVIAGLDWLRVNHPDATVVNLSLGTSERFPGDCDDARAFTRGFAQVVAGLRAQGTVVTASSGNNASSVDMGAPACVRDVVSVAAVWDADFGTQTLFGCTDDGRLDHLTCFSNLSTSTDLLAPGAFLTAAGATAPDITSTFAGTSMAAPLVAGCVALLRQAFPEASPEAIETALRASPSRRARPPMTQDYPRLDCQHALTRLDALLNPPQPLDEPSASGVVLPVPIPADANCPAGFFVATVEDGPGEGLRSGAFGMELLLDAPGTRVLAGGLNFGGLVDTGQVGFAGFTIANAANEPQRLNLSLTGSPSASSQQSYPLRIRISRRPDASTVQTVFDSTHSISLSTPFQTSLELIPGFYEATVAPTTGSPGGAPEGQFFFSLTTSFLDRPGGGFQGGAVVGGYHAVHPFAGVSGFAAFCLATPHSASLRVLSAPSYGPSGAGDLRLRILDARQNSVIAVPGD